MNLEAITHLWNYRPRKFRSDAFLFWSRGPDSYRKNDRKRAVVWPWLVLQLSTVLALTQLGIRQSDWRRAGIRSTNLHIVVECVIKSSHQGICSCSPSVNFLEVTFYHGMVTSVICLIKKIILINTLNMKICWVFMQIWIIFKSCCSLWHVKNFRKYNHMLNDIFMYFSVPILWKYC